MVMFTIPDPPGGHHSYYATRRTPFAALGNPELSRYHTEVTPAYDDHDARIRGIPSAAQLSSEQARFRSSTDKALHERSSSCRREVQSSVDKALVQRSSSCSREVQTSGNQRADVREYIKHGAHGKEYVIEEEIPSQYNYHIPCKKTQMELMTLGHTDARAQSVPPRPETQSQWIKIPTEPVHLYYAPIRSSEHKLWSEPKQATYFENRRDVFSEPKGSELKHYDFKIIPSDKYDVMKLKSSSYLDRSRSRSREHALKQHVIYEDDFPDAMHHLSTSRNENFEKALVPFDRSQSVPPSQKEYTYQWIKIPTGPATITEYPKISSSDPRTWAQEEPLRITNYDTHKAADSRYSHDNDVVSRTSSQNKEKSVREFVTYEHFPKKDMSLEREIAIDQRFDRCHKDNHGSEYRSKWVRFPRGPSAFIYSSIHSRDKEAIVDPTLTGYVGSGSFLESREKSANKNESEFTQTSASSVNKATSRVNKILNTKEDFENKHFVDMLFNIQHILKEREALGAYEISPRIRNKMKFLTKAINNVSHQNKNRKDIGSHPTDSVKSLLSFSSLLAPIRPDRGRQDATSRFNYMLHGPRVL